MIFKKFLAFLLLIIAGLIVFPIMALVAGVAWAIEELWNG
jgi:hypothetical protein